MTDKYPKLAATLQAGEKLVQEHHQGSPIQSVLQHSSITIPAGALPPPTGVLPPPTGVLPPPTNVLSTGVLPPPTGALPPPPPVPC